LPDYSHASAIVKRVQRAHDDQKPLADVLSPADRQVLRVERTLRELDKTWRDWPSELRFKLMLAIEQGVWAAAGHRLSEPYRTQARQALARAARIALSAVRMERLGKIERSQELAREAVTAADDARLRIGIGDSRGAFAILIDQARDEASRLGLSFPTWRLVRDLADLAESGYAAEPIAQSNATMPARRFGRTKLTFPLTMAQARALAGAERILRSAANPKSSK
jgi:hypothetical protein